MLKIDVARVASVASATSPNDLFDALQSAIELEHSTIPLYMTSVLSIKDSAIGSMRQISRTISDIMIQEMLHMNIACNILIAIGGNPSINHPGFIPTYPGRLPMVGNFEVHLAPLSFSQLDTFLEIEEPEHPINFPVHAMAVEAIPVFATIGQFYRAIIAKLKEFGSGTVVGHPELQVTDAFAQAPAITTLDDAIAGLNLIIDQGEGTESSPLASPDGKNAHFYRFKEIKIGKTLKVDSSSPQGFSFGDPPILFDPAEIEDMVSDPRAAIFTGEARTAVDTFNAKYSRLLDNLHQAFSGGPNSLDISAMSDLLDLGKKVVTTRDPVIGKNAAPSFEYLP